MTNAITPETATPAPTKLPLGVGMVQQLGWGGLAAGLLASSCCILPLALVSLGIGGVWVGKLTALAPYQPVFLTLAAALIGTGLWRAYRKQENCAPGSLCEVPSATRATKALLWIGAVVAAASASVNLFVPYFFGY
jgi:mercuric ion transport protein